MGNNQGGPLWLPPPIARRSRSLIMGLVRTTIVGAPATAVEPSRAETRASPAIRLCRRSVGKENLMSKVDELKAEIERLPSEEFAELFRWLSEKDWQEWDREIEADSRAGRLDFLVREAGEEKAKKTLKDL